MTALTAWAEALRQWEIPAAALARAEESPWVLPREVFTRRADRFIEGPAGATFDHARRALDRPGSVLDVGAAAGAASLPLVGRAPVTEVTGIEADTELLDAFTWRARQLGVSARGVCGRWPEVSGEVSSADVVLCSHVIYNVTDLASFVAALSSSARRRVVVENAARHPLTELNPLWRRFHGIDRPDGPTAEDFLAALRELGVDPEVVRWRRNPEPEYASFDDLVGVVRRRVCLPRSEAPEVRAALLDLGVDPSTPPDLGSSGRDVMTVSWTGSGT